MKKAITEAQFTEAVFRHYHGETLEEIANDFGISPNTLKSIKSRKSGEWENQREQLINSKYAELAESKQKWGKVLTAKEQEAFDRISWTIAGHRLLDYGLILRYLNQNYGYSPTDAEKYIKAFAKQVLRITTLF